MYRLCREYKEYNRIGYIYEGVLGLIDRSIQAKGKPFYVHLFTSDVSGNFISAEEFDKADKAIGTSEQNNAKKQLQASIDKRLTRVVTQSTFQRPVCLVLEPIRSEKMLFRVINTKII